MGSNWRRSRSEWKLKTTDTGDAAYEAVILLGLGGCLEKQDKIRRMNMVVRCQDVK
jgi:hypothetical protein